MPKQQPPSAGKQKSNADLPESFEGAVAELEALVQKMDAPNVGLETLLKDYKRGAQLVKFCKDRLQTVRAEVSAIDLSLQNSTDEGRP